jgi:hypothetical protein
MGAVSVLAVQVVTGREISVPAKDRSNKAPDRLMGRFAYPTCAMS